MILLGQVELLAGAEDDSGLLRDHGAVDGDLVQVLPVVVAVVDVEDDLGAASAGQHDGLEGSLSGGALGKGGTGDQDGLGLADILFLDVIHGELQVRDAVAVHEDVALDGDFISVKVRPSFSPFVQRVILDVSMPCSLK